MSVWHSSQIGTELDNRVSQLFELEHGFLCVNIWYDDVLEVLIQNAARKPKKAEVRKVTQLVKT